MIDSELLEVPDPIRVLVVGRDRRFLRAVDVLLSRHGCEVAHVDRPSELLDRVRGQHPNVVLLDGSDSISATADAVATLEGLPTPVPTLIVYEGTAGESLRRLSLLPKWGPFEELLSEVERLHGNNHSGRAAVEPIAP
jgi:CheY-like chemotaxis protein